MNYEDFDVIYTNEKYKQVIINDGCPENKLKTCEDDFFGSIFGKDSQLLVIGHNGLKGNKKKFILKCTECSKDEELHGDGLFQSVKSSLNNGSMPCGCSCQHLWTKEQYITKIERKCESLGIIFQGFSSAFNGHKTKLNLYCRKHNSSSHATINEFMSTASNGCYFCGKGKSGTFKDDLYMISTFLPNMNDEYKQNYIFGRSNKTNHWRYRCNKCSNDEYAQNGLCSGIFETFTGTLQQNGLSCRCSKAYKWTKEQREYQIKKKMKESGTTDRFIGWPDSAYVKFIRACEKHGEYTTLLKGYLNRNSCCPECAGQDQKQCYINLIEDGNLAIGLKFGISRDSKNRILNLNSTSIFNMRQIGIWQFSDVKSCKDAEKHIKKNIKCKIFTKQEVPHGYTETTSINNMNKIIEIYERFGGVRVY